MSPRFNTPPENRAQFQPSRFPVVDTVEFTRPGFVTINDLDVPLAMGIEMLSRMGRAAQ